MTVRYTFSKAPSKTIDTLRKSSISIRFPSISRMIFSNWLEKKGDLHIDGNAIAYFRLLMGPERSGSTIHIDPLNTSAWNTSLFGHKRWVLMDENLPKSIVKGKKFRYRNYNDEAINYFT